MGCQLIFVVETNKKCNSDWIYLKDTIEHFYSYERTQVKLSPVYMDGKGNYRTKKKEVQLKIKQYSATSKENHSTVIYCFDCDEYDNNSDDLTFLKEAQKFCKNENYQLAWFCKDIEQVYLGKRINKIQKKSEAEKFKKNKEISNITPKILCEKNFKINRSNILCVLDNIPELIRKNNPSQAT